MTMIAAAHLEARDIIRCPVSGEAHAITRHDPRWHQARDAVLLHFASASVESPQRPRFLSHLCVSNPVTPGASTALLVNDERRGFRLIGHEVLLEVTNR